MPPVQSNLHDVKVLFRRLLIPEEIVSDAAHLNSLVSVKDSISESNSFNQNPFELERVFLNYEPSAFRPDVVKKAYLLRSEQQGRIQEGLKTKADAEVELKALQDQDAATPKSDLAAKKKLEDAIRAQQEKINHIDSMLSSLTQTIGHTPFYEPILLDVQTGVYSVTTNLSRNSPGTASVTFQFPLESNTLAPDILMALRSEDVFSMDLMEKGQSSATGSPLDFKAVSSHTLPILKSNMRETIFKPYDMIQIWARKRFASGWTFPNDYTTIFTGFILKPSITYNQSQITVKIDAEDVGKTLRLSRTAVDVPLLPQYRQQGIELSMFENKVIGTYGSGAEIIKQVILGSPGSFMGLSNAEVIQSVGEVTQNGQTVMAFTKTGTVQLASDFEKIRLNLFEDLNTHWDPYAKAIRTSFKLWETEYKTKWDICKEIAEKTEFEFYTDNLGVINYHPPLYFLNPFNVQYYIEDLDVISETHSIDEQAVFTSVEVSSQGNYKAPPNYVGNLTSYVTAPPSIIQRFGLRHFKVEVPLFSGNESPSNQFGLTVQDRDNARKTYARALLNRRNAMMRSASVTINGMPEMRLCNTVAFVKNGTDTLQKVAESQLAGVANLGLSGSGIGPVQGMTGIVPTAENSLRGLVGVKSGIFNVLKDVMVYYISGIQYSYTQGGRATTSLTLTHGRRFTDPLPEGNFGFGFDPTDTTNAMTATRSTFGQEGADKDAEAFVNVMRNKLLFQSTGSVEFLDPPTQLYDFGLTATRDRKPPPKKKPTSIVSGGGHTIDLSDCKRVLKKPLLQSAGQWIKDEAKNVKNEAGDAFKFAWGGFLNFWKGLGKFDFNLFNFGSSDDPTKKPPKDLTKEAKKAIRKAAKEAAAKAKKAAKDAIRKKLIEEFKKVMGTTRLDLRKIFEGDSRTDTDAVLALPEKAFGVLSSASGTVLKTLTKLTDGFTGVGSQITAKFSESVNESEYALSGAMDNVLIKDSAGIIGYRFPGTIIGYTYTIVRDKKDEYGVKDELREAVFKKVEADYGVDRRFVEILSISRVYQKSTTVDLISALPELGAIDTALGGGSEFKAVVYFSTGLIIVGVKTTCP